MFSEHEKGNKCPGQDSYILEEHKKEEEELT